MLMMAIFLPKGMGIDRVNHGTGKIISDTLFSIRKIIHLLNLFQFQVNSEYKAFVFLNNRVRCTQPL